MHCEKLIKKTPKCCLEPIPVPVRSKAFVCAPLSAGIASSNTVEGIDARLLCLLCCVGSGICDKPITCSEESYRVCVQL
jgi:hypothetical protein